MKTVQCSK